MRDSSQYTWVSRASVYQRPYGVCEERENYSVSAKAIQCMPKTWGEQVPGFTKHINNYYAREAASPHGALSTQ